MVVVVKDLETDERVGSVSFPQEIFTSVGSGKYTQWVTLFDHLDDDEYDGEMGEQDDEEPRILCNFEILPVTEKPPAAKPKNAEVVVAPKEKSPIRVDEPIIKPEPMV